MNFKNKEDMNLINEIKNLCNNFLIYDARPYINSASNKVKGEVLKMSKIMNALN